MNGNGSASSEMPSAAAMVGVAKMSRARNVVRMPSTMATIGAVQKTRYIDLLSTTVDNAERAMDLNQIVVFEAVVREGSFTAAARALGQPKSTVSKRVAELEARLRARLLNRSTRRVAPTEEGALYYEHCRTIVRDLEAADRALRDREGAPRGLVRMKIGRAHV